MPPKIIKNERGPARADITLMAVYSFEETSTFKFTRTTITAKTNWPSVERQPRKPFVEIDVSKVLKAKKHNKVPCQTAYVNQRQKTHLLKNTSSSPIL